MKIYFDACCINRLTDDQTQTRIRQEAEAIEVLIGLATREPNIWVGSAVLEVEISRNKDAEQRADAESLLAFVKQIVPIDSDVVNRGRQLQVAGLSEFDALHVACAESSGVDIFLTTDDRLLRQANRLQSSLALRILNPISFLREVRNANSPDV